MPVFANKSEIQQYFDKLQIIFSGVNLEIRYLADDGEREPGDKVSFDEYVPNIDDVEPVSTRTQRKGMNKVLYTNLIIAGRFKIKEEIRSFAFAIDTEKTTHADLFRMMTDLCQELINLVEL